MKRFTLRDLFWLVLVVGMGCGWSMEHRRHAGDSQTIKDLSFQRDAYMLRAEQLLDGVQQLEHAAVEGCIPIQSSAHAREALSQVQIIE